MSDTGLAQAVEKFARLTHALSDGELERPWAWKEYDEGLRVAFFRTYEELRELAATLAAARAAGGPALTTAQRVLAQYHAAYRDLQAVVLGVADDELDRAPAAGEWPLRAVLEHMVRADWGFFAVTRHALEQHRRGGPAERPSSEARKALWRSEGPAFEAALGGSLADILAYHDALHGRILRELADIKDSEIGAPSWFWESEPFPLQFRLHRFDAHLRQHTIQAEKALDALGRGPSEAMRLLRLIYAALAEAEGVTIGADGFGAEQQRTVATEIAMRAGAVGVG